MLPTPRGRACIFDEQLCATVTPDYPKVRVEKVVREFDLFSSAFEDDRAPITRDAEGPCELAHEVGDAHGCTSREVVEEDVGRTVVAEVVALRYRVEETGSVGRPGEAKDRLRRVVHYERFSGSGAAVSHEVYGGGFEGLGPGVEDVVGGSGGRAASE